MLDRYSASFELQEEKSPTLKLLTYLIQQHLKLYTFSSINVLLKRPLSLEIESIENRFLNQEGGYCFEHNRLFFLLLESLGFEVKSYLGRVLLNVPRDVPKTHRLNIVTLDGVQYVVDVGFGPYSPSQPIKLNSDATQCVTSLIYNVTATQDGGYTLNLLKERAPFLLYSFDMQIYNEKDYELAHFYSHQHPDANFVKNLVVSRQEDGVVYALINSSFQVFGNVSSTTEEIITQKQLEKVLKQYFFHALNEQDLTQLFKVISNR